MKSWSRSRRTESDAFDNLSLLAARGFIDDVIEASQARPMLIRSLELLKTKDEDKPVRKHGNIPL
jgi:propionyl-CoA carboxylase beta chain